MAEIKYTYKYCSIMEDCSENGRCNGIWSATFWETNIVFCPILKAKKGIEVSIELFGEFELKMRKSLKKNKEMSDNTNVVGE